MGEYIENTNSPPHYFVPDSIYMVTACTYKKVKHFAEARTTKFFLDTLFKLVRNLQWELDAWVVLHNHYHLIVRVGAAHYQITRLIRPLHSITAKFVNDIDGAFGRRVWQNYWDTAITFEESYLARLQYVHFNPVKHGMGNDPLEYEYSSYRWFMKNENSVLQKKFNITQFDRVNIRDEF